jgi:hypothetical protein
MSLLLKGQTQFLSLIYLLTENIVSIFSLVINSVSKFSLTNEAVSKNRDSLDQKLSIIYQKLMSIIVLEHFANAYPIFIH